VAVPLPAPLAPAVTVIHEVLLTAVHVQPAPAVTVRSLLVDADAPTDGLVGVTPYMQGTLHEKLFDAVLLDVPPGPTAATSAKYVRPGCGIGLKTVARLTRIFPSDCGAGFPSETTWSGVVAPAKYNSSWYDCTAGEPPGNTVLWSADGLNSTVFGFTTLCPKA
jgi:hypothetical protein